MGAQAMFWGTPLSIVLHKQQNSCSSLLTVLYPVLCMLRSSQYVNSQHGCMSVLGAVSGFPGLSGSTLFPFWKQRAWLETPGRKVI